MVAHRSNVLDGVFHPLADPTRRAMLRALSPGERTIRDLAAPFDMTLAAASKHVRVLEKPVSYCAACTDDCTIANCARSL